MLEDIERDIEEYKKIIEIKNKQLADIKKILQRAKNSYQELTKENKQLKQYKEENDIDSNLITVYNFFAHLIKEIGVTRYGNDR